MRRRWWIAGTLLALALAYSCAHALRSPAPAPLRPEPARWSDDDLHVAYLGHASVLIDFLGTVLLTDPVFFERIGMTLGPLTIGPKRLVESALRPDELPHVDAVVISHAHMDSLDPPSLRAVASSPVVVTPERTADLVERLGFDRVIELPWGERAEVAGVTIDAVKLRHWGERWPWDRWRGYNAYLLTKGDLAVLFAPDTAYTEAVGELGKRSPIDVAILGNGAYDPWIRNHASPEEVWRMFRESGAPFLVPIHWDTFRLGKEPVGDAMSRLLRAAGDDADRVVIREIGGTWTLTRERRADMAEPR